MNYSVMRKIRGLDITPTPILQNAHIFLIIWMGSQMLMLGLFSMTFNTEGTKVLVSVIMSQPVNMVEV